MLDLGPALLLVASGIGFRARTRCHEWRLQMAVREWDRSLFECTLLGLAILVAARFLAVSVYHWSIVESARPLVAQVLPIKFAGSILLAFFLAELTAAVKNGADLPEEVVGRVIGNLTDQLQRLLVTSASHGHPVMLTMTDNKVYVGLVLEAPSVEHQKAFVLLIPTLSGYRKSDRTVEFTTSYAWVHETPAAVQATKPSGTLKLQDFGVLLPLDQVASARRFDSSAYRRFANPGEAKPATA